MSVSVVIAVKNGAHYIAEAVNSALAQPETDLVVVVDDHSTDHTPDVVRGLPDQRVRLIRGSGLGVSAARNAGFAEAEAQMVRKDGFVLFLDADDRLRPGALGHLATAATPECIAVYGDYERVDEGGQILGRRQWLKGRKKPTGDILATLVAGNFIVNGGVILIRQDAFRRIGGFDETLRYCEDWHAFCRLAALGPILYQPTIVLDYRVHAASVMMRAPVSFAHYQLALDRVFGDPQIRCILSARGIDRLAANARAHLRAYLACQAVRSRAYRRAVLETSLALRSAPRRALRTMAHVVGAAAGL
jgi:glycosyltransferase involved in cell wall biosynthesis